MRVDIVRPYAVLVSTPCKAEGCIVQTRSVENLSVDRADNRFECDCSPGQDYDTRKGRSKDAEEVRVQGFAEGKC